ncbi:MAG: SDR family NAD(P)-dependent oxidoreductase [Acidobacteria bacterium]|nr:SDR family NAD(P)-dependent oxidoreductase [Acidobacteriota bacterium]
MELTATRAIVAGGASGLGAACVRMLAANGASVAILDVNETAGRALAAELGPSATFFEADVSNETAVKSAIEAFRPIQIAINCAGIAPAQRTVGKEGPAPLDWFATVVRVNLIGTFNVARLAAAAMSANQPNSQGERGVIVNTASIAAFDGQIGQVAYAASKGGIVGLTLPMARDLSRLGIRVVTIAPGIFDTPLLGKMPEEVRASLGAQTPFPPRLGQPSEYAHLARHIIENTMLNGEVIRLDGAMRMAPK